MFGKLAPRIKGARTVVVAGGGMVCLNRVVVSGGTPTTITFANIPQDYNDLMISFQGRDSSTSVTNTSLRMKINGDATAANYSTAVYDYATSAASGGVTTISPSTAGMYVLDLSASLGSSVALTGGTVTIVNYAGSLMRKIFHTSMFLFNGSGDGSGVVRIGGFYVPTTPISNIVLTTGGSGFVAGTTATLYGIV